MYMCLLGLGTILQTAVNHKKLSVGFTEQPVVNTCKHINFSNLNLFIQLL